ncbi:MAG: hypothetical protein HRU28_08530 [Rhizobiales bacterium]|nr:hypothetical protein [Hyphomicrobiales bacterium]
MPANTNTTKTAQTGKLTQAGYPVRPRAEFYTPHWVTEECLLPHISPARHILEPAVGDGGIKKVLEAYGHEVMGIDIHPDPSVDLQMSFLDFTNPDNIKFDIISNPPYFKPHNIDRKFILHALELTKPHSGMVAMLLPVAYDCGDTRRDIFETENTFKHQIVLTRRISWSNVPVAIDKKGKPVGAAKNHAWYIWQHGNNEQSSKLYAPVNNAHHHPSLNSYAEDEAKRKAEAARIFLEMAVVS